MRKKEMNEEQLRQRSLFVDSLANAGWRGSNFNHNFDEGLWSSPEASMTYSNRQMSLRLDLSFEDPRMIFYLGSKSGKSLGLVFKCGDRQKSLLDAVIGMQDSIGPDSIKDKSEDLLAICPNMFKISASGGKLIPIKPKKSK
ncbi:MAG: hypothetical protein QOJ84_351 [Bradyrhizobium sp.]|jgi:hypothetical protein|nr:hypothetical protein [Bradyrhizobium sp.]